MKSRPLPRFALYPNRPTVGPADLMNVKKTEAEALHVVHITGRDAIKFFEEVGLVFRRYARPFIGYVEVELFVFAASAKTYFWWAATIFDGIVKQVVQDIGKVNGVGRDVKKAFREVGLKASFQLFRPGGDAAAKWG